MPDFDDARPKQWSYRDLVLVRLFVWLRQAGQKPDHASARIRMVREVLEGTPAEALPDLRADRYVLLVDDEGFDRLTGQQVLSGLGAYLGGFEFTDALPELPHRLWGPNLVRPSTWTSIQPLVMAGEPCIRSTRVTTANVWALKQSRGLSDAAVAELYPGIDVEQVADAAALEQRLRPERAAA